MSERFRGLAEKLSGYKYVLIVAAVGLALLLWPSGKSAGGAQTEPTEEARLASVLTGIEGVGEAEVLLSDEGAVIVCEGALDASVRLGVTRAVRCYTGLGADRVEIFKMDQKRRDEH